MGGTSGCCSKRTEWWWQVQGYFSNVGFPSALDGCAGSAGLCAECLHGSGPGAGQGFAALAPGKRLMQEVLAECRRRNVPTVVLHASPMGRGVYEGILWGSAGRTR